MTQCDLRLTHEAADTPPRRPAGSSCVPVSISGAFAGIAGPPGGEPGRTEPDMPGYPAAVRPRAVATRPKAVLPSGVPGSRPGGNCCASACRPHPKPGRAGTHRGWPPAIRRCATLGTLLRRPDDAADPGDWLSGRAPRSHRGGHWFDPSIAHHSDPGVLMIGRDLILPVSAISAAT